MVDELTAALRRLPPEDLPHPPDRPARVIRRARAHRRMVWSVTALAVIAAGGGAATAATTLAGSASGLHPLPAGPAGRAAAAMSRPTAAPSQAQAQPSASAGTPQGPLVGACTIGVLQVSLGPQQGAAGTFFQNILFRNTGPVACSLAGYPGVSFTDRGGTQLGESAREVNAFDQPLRTVVIPANSLAQATTGVPDPGAVAPGSCRQATSYGIRVYPPNLKQSVILPLRGEPVCTTGGYRPFVTPVVLSGP